MNRREQRKQRQAKKQKEAKRAKRTWYLGLGVSCCLLFNSSVASVTSCSIVRRSFFGRRSFVIAEASEIVGSGALGFAEGEDSFLGGVPLAGFGRLDDRVERFEFRVGHLAFGALIGNLLFHAAEPFGVLGRDGRLQGGEDVAVGSGELRGDAAEARNQDQNVARGK